MIYQHTIFIDCYHTNTGVPSSLPPFVPWQAGLLPRGSDLVVEMRLLPGCDKLRPHAVLGCSQVKGFALNAKPRSSFTPSSHCPLLCQ